jgi:hypothetical protein
MSGGLSATFLKAALAPLHFANVTLMGRIVTSALHELATDNLSAHLGDAIDKTAKAAGVRPWDIRRLLPMDRFEALLETVRRHQPLAVKAWRDQPVTSRRSADLGLRNEQGQYPNLPDSLLRLARLAGRDTELGGSLAGLAEAMGEWQRLVLAAGGTFDDDRALRAAYRRRSLRRGLVLLAIAALGGGGAWLWQRLEQARYRVNAALGNLDPCAVLGIDARDLERATAEQREQVDRRRRACEDGRERAEKERVEKERRAAYERDCAALAEQVDKGQPIAPGAALDLLKPERELCEHVASGALAARDFGPKDPTFPCQDTSSAPRFLEAFARAVTASRLWIDAPELSERVRSILSRKPSAIPEAVRRELDVRAEQIATQSLIESTPWALARAKRLCEIKDAIGLDNRMFCRVVRSK